MTLNFLHHKNSWFCWQQNKDFIWLMIMICCKMDQLDSDFSNSSRILWKQSARNTKYGEWIRTFLGFFSGLEYWNTKQSPSSSTSQFLISAQLNSITWLCQLINLSNTRLFPIIQILPLVFHPHDMLSTWNFWFQQQRWHVPLSGHHMDSGEMWPHCIHPGIERDLGTEKYNLRNQNSHVSFHTSFLFEKSCKAFSS